MNYIKVCNYQENGEGTAFIGKNKYPFVIKCLDDDGFYLNFPFNPNDIIFLRLGYNDAYDFYDKYHIPYINRDGVWPFTRDLLELKTVITLINKALNNKDSYIKITIF